MLNVIKICRDFPILKRRINGKPLVYLDSAATSQKPEQVIRAIVDYYQNHNANVHRGIHALAGEATSLYEEARKKIAEFINAKNEKEIIFTKNATEGINLVAYAFAGLNFKKGDEIVTTLMEHHANFVPWQQIASEKGFILKVIDFEEDGRLDLDKLEKAVSEKTKLVAVTWVSNVLGTINPVGEIGKIAHKKGTLVLVDGAQKVPHIKTDVQKEDFDFLVFTGHKMLAPMGIGVLWAKEEILEKTRPFLFGGDMIREVSLKETTFNDLPWKFEAGTPNVGGAAGLAAAIDYLKNVGLDKIREHEKKLIEYAFKRMEEISETGKKNWLTVYGPKEVKDRSGLISFNIKGVHPHDVAQILNDEFGIAIRSGHHCCMPLHQRLGIAATCRASFYLYNTKEEVDLLIEGIKKVREMFRK